MESTRRAVLLDGDESHRRIFTYLTELVTRTQGMTPELQQICALLREFRELCCTPNATANCILHDKLLLDLETTAAALASALGTSRKMATQYLAGEYR